MSLSKLPEELVAQVASHLNYEDVCNFMESSSRNYHVVKRYRMDKIKLDVLYVRMLTNGTIRYSAVVHFKKYTFKAFNLHEQPIDMIKKMLEQVSSLDELCIEFMKIRNDLVQMLMATKTKIGSLCFFENETFELPVAEFIELCQRFDISLNDVQLERSFWTEEVLCQILPRTSIRSFEDKDCRNAITDKTLEALTGGIKAHKSYLALKWFLTSFTIKGILEAFEKVRDKKMDEVCWNLGILHSNQSADAMRYLENGDFGQYNVKVSEDDECKQYKITKHEIGEVRNVFCICFAVEKI